jgi:hypothetical protein
MNYIMEFRSLAECLAGNMRPDILLESFGWQVFVIVGTACGAARKAFPRGWLGGILFVTLPAVAVQALSIVQVRWHPVALSLWLVAAFFLVLGYLRGPRPFPVWSTAGFLLAAIPAALIFPLFEVAEAAAASNPARSIPGDTVPTILLRDIAHRLVQSSPQALPVVLTDPSSSTQLSYFGGIKTIGTLYWENLPGLVKTARFFGEPDPARLLSGLQACSISHILLCSWDESLTLLPKLLGENAGAKGLLQAIAAGEADPPDWLRPLAYPIPPTLGAGRRSVALYQVIPGQSHSRALFFRALFEVQRGNTSRAVRLLRSALEADPSNQEAGRLLKDLQAGGMGGQSP